jgi:hypothetical protein
MPLLEFYSGSYRHPFDPLSRPFDNLFCVPYRGPRFQLAHKQKPLRLVSFPGVRFKKIFNVLSYPRINFSLFWSPAHKLIKYVGERIS